MRTMRIEEALTWAYVSELPKVKRMAAMGPIQTGRSWDVMETYLEVLTVIDVNRYGVVPDLSAEDEPTADAVLIGEAVEALDAVAAGAVFDAFDADVLIADLDPVGLGAPLRRSLAMAIDRATIVDRDGDRRLRGGFSTMLRRCAILDMAPDWRMSAPSLVPKRGPNGKAVWVRTISRPVMWDRDGNVVGREDVEVEAPPINGRPRPGSRRLEVLDPDPVSGLVERLRYLAWRAALDMLAERLSDATLDVNILPSTVADIPWLGDVTTPRQIREVTTATPVVEVSPRRPTKRKTPMRA
jgi:hypothetical protein